MQRGPPLVLLAAIAGVASAEAALPPGGGPSLRSLVPPLRTRPLVLRAGGGGSGGGAVVVVAQRLRELRAWYAGLPTSFRLRANFVAGVIVGLALAMFFGSLEIFSTVDDVPGVAFRDHWSIPARVVSVSDGDTLRALHMPPLARVRRSLRPQAGRPKLSETTLMIRLAAVDTPEIGKFGKSSQAFAEEARDFARGKVLGRLVQVRLLSRDQYGRAVASIRFWTPWFPFRRDLGTELVKEGLAVVYRQAGAQYDSPDGVATWDRLEEVARARGKGMWAAGRAVELPSAYKAKMRSARSA